MKDDNRVLIIGGDFNARIGGEGKLSIEEEERTRKTEDETEGRQDTP